MRRHEFVSNQRRRKNPEKTCKETKINKVPDKQFNAQVKRMLTELGKRTDEHSQNFNKELENIKKNQSELKNTITEMKKTHQKEITAGQVIQNT